MVSRRILFTDWSYLATVVTAVPVMWPTSTVQLVSQLCRLFDLMTSWGDQSIWQSQHLLLKNHGFTGFYWSPQEVIRSNNLHNWETSWTADAGYIIRTAVTIVAKYDHCFLIETSFGIVYIASTNWTGCLQKHDFQLWHFAMSPFTCEILPQKYNIYVVCTLFKRIRPWKYQP